MSNLKNAIEQGNMVFSAYAGRECGKIYIEDVNVKNPMETLNGDIQIYKYINDDGNIDYFVDLECIYFIYMDGAGFRWGGVIPKTSKIVKASKIYIYNILIALETFMKEEGIVYNANYIIHPMNLLYDIVNRPDEEYENILTEYYKIKALYLYIDSVDKNNQIAENETEV